MNDDNAVEDTEAIAAHINNDLTRLNEAHDDWRRAQEDQDAAARATATAKANYAEVFDTVKANGYVSTEMLKRRGHTRPRKTNSTTA